MSDVGCVTVAGRLVAVTNTDVENNNKTHSLTIKMERNHWEPVGTVKTPANTASEGEESSSGKVGSNQGNKDLYQCQ